MPWSVRPCGRCGESMGLRHRTAKFCQPCQEARFRDNGGTAAHLAVRREIAAGRLKPANNFACVDCGAPACDYDHRDYAKPLEVQPVCRKCNRARGPARPVLTFELPDADSGVVGADPGVVSHRDEASLFLSFSTSPNASEEMS